MIAQRLHRLREPAGSDYRCSLGVPGCIGSPAFVFCGQLEVEAQLLLELGIPAARSKRSPDTDHPLAKPGH
ncbi:MAG: hypothetical protein GEV06_18030 [Luteitalea sp.]|nr:hypothetical protein [Luteitalea sp.]